MRISILAVALFLVTATCDLTETDLLADENREKPRKAVEASVEMERGDFSSSAPDPASTRRDKPIANPGFNVRPVSLLPVVGEEGHLVDAQLTEESNRQPSPAKASVSTFSNSSRQGTACLRVGVGFTLDPETFLSAFEGNYFVHNNVAVGPLVQVGVSGNRLILGTTVNVRGVFDLPNHDLAATCFVTSCRIKCLVGISSFPGNWFRPVFIFDQGTGNTRRPAARA